jgi:hypothetical protein
MVCSKAVRLIACSIALVSCVRPLMAAGPAAREAIDQDYVLALSAANRFLYAWQMRDQESGLSLVSQRLKRAKSEEELRTYISGVSNPHHQAFEIGPGQRLKDGRFTFQVRLYEHYTAEKWKGQRPRPGRIVLVRLGPEEWRVDELPGYAGRG